MRVRCVIFINSLEESAKDLHIFGTKSTEHTHTHTHDKENGVFHKGIKSVCTDIGYNICGESVIRNLKPEMTGLVTNGISCGLRVRLRKCFASQMTSLTHSQKDNQEARVL